MQSNLYIKFLGLILKKGKKGKIKIILDNVFTKLQRLLRISFIYILNQLFLFLNTFVESKIIKIKRRSYIIPFPISLKRRIYLVLKWLIGGVLFNKKKLPFGQKLMDEILLIIKNQPCKSLSLKKDNLIQSLSNRSNAHFRW